MREVIYGCGCKAAGDNIAVYCPMHGNPERGRTSLEARCEFLNRENEDLRADLQATARALNQARQGLDSMAHEGIIMEGSYPYINEALALPSVVEVLKNG